MSDDWAGPDEATIAAELARVVLGGRGPARPEQRMDALGSLVRMSIAHRLAVSTIAVAFLPALRNATEALARTMREVQAVFDRPAGKGTE